MDLVYDALDAFNRAGKISFNVDIELEAISEGLIGKVWYKALKNLQKSRPHLYDCVRLANLLYPKVVTEETWYQLASKHLLEVREKMEKIDTENEKKEKEKFYEMIKD